MASVAFEALAGGADFDGRLPPHCHARGDTTMANGRSGISRRHHRSRPAADYGFLAWAHSPSYALLPSPRHCGHHERQFRRANGLLASSTGSAMGRRGDRPPAVGERPFFASRATWQPAGRPGLRSMARGGRRVWFSRERYGWRRPRGTRCCRSTWKPPGTGRPTAGTARRFPSHLQPWRCRWGNPLTCRPMRKQQVSNRRAVSSMCGFMGSSTGFVRCYRLPG